jgi:hypothetical protein
MKELEEANQILDKIVLPSGDEQFILHKFKDNSYVRKVTDKQQVYINQEISKKLFGNTKRKFSSPDVMDSYILSLSEHYQKLMSSGFVFNRGIIVGDTLFSDPIVKPIDGKLYYEFKMLLKDGSLKTTNPDDVFDLSINPENALQTLAKARVIDRGCRAITGGIHKNAEGFSPIRSYFADDPNSDSRKFYVDCGGVEYWPGYSYLASKLVSQHQKNNF